MTQERESRDRKIVRLGMVGILCPDEGEAAGCVLGLLGEFSGIIRHVADIPSPRGGMNLTCVTVEVSTDDLGSFTGRLGLVKGVKVKSLLL
jgi:hypothetical protein